MQALNLQLRGLYTHPNPLSEVPPGALLRAENCVMDKEGIIENRRGFKSYGTDGVIKTDQLFNFKNRLIKAYDSKLAYDSDGAGTWTDYTGAYDAPTGAINIRGLEASKNFYFTTSDGVFKLDAVAGTPGLAGMFKALDGSGVKTALGTGFFTNGNQVAYRIVWGITDANNNLILGSPSSRITVVNAGATPEDVILTFTIPAGITVNHFYQIYRSGLSGGAAITPNDEMGLVIEDNPTAGEITAGTITLTDSTPDNLRGATIYTAPSQQGIAQSNDQPPLAQDIAFYKNTTFYANTKSKQRYTITLISVGGAGLAVNDTITIGGVVYTGKAAETAASGEFKVETGLTPAENIDVTAQSLVRVINLYASNTAYYAYYLSGYGDLPGKILIEERTIGGASFAIISSKGGAFNPTLPSSGTAISSTNEESKNRIYISKVQQPEAVPVGNYIDVGSADKNIYRVISLRDSVFIFKEDGVFRLTGESRENFAVSLFDVTVILTAPESAVPFNNQIYAYTTQGVVAISDTGSQIMSRPVEVDLLPITTYTNFASITFGVAYNSDRKYILFVQTLSTDTYPTQAYVYNAISNQWTTWVMSRGCGIVNSADDKLYLGDAASGFIYQERKSYTLDDYADREVSVTVVSSSGTQVTLASTVGVTAGWQLYQAVGISNILSVDDLTTITVSDTLNWSAGVATVLEPISTEFQTIQQTAGNPGILKHFRDITIFFRKANFRQLAVGVQSDLSNSVEKTDIAPFVEGLWGQFQWGTLGWGGGGINFQAIRTYIPRNKNRAHWILISVTHSYARDYFAIAGLSLMYAPMSERFK
jgi:hypothetical protein